MKVWAKCFAVLSMHVAALPAAHGFSTEAGVWPGATTTFYVDIPGGNGLWNDAFEAAAQRWNDATPYFRFEIVRGVFKDPCDDPSQVEPRNGVKFSDTICGVAYGANVLAVEGTWTQGDGTFALQSGIWVNSGLSWAVYNGPTQAGSFDFRRTMVHELGHSLGLGHESYVSSIMRPSIGNLESPTDDDKAGVAFLYENPVEPPPDAPDLAITEFSVSPSMASPGGAVSIRYKLTNQGSMPAGGSTTEVRLASSSTDVTAADTLLTTNEVPALYMGSWYAREAEVSVPALPPGRYHLWVIADVADTAGQPDRANDRAHIPFEVTGGPARPLPIVSSLPDVNGDGTPDLAVVREGSTNAEIRDGEAGVLLGSLAFLSAAFSPVAAAVLPDTDGDEVPEFALLAVRHTDSRLVAQIRNLDGSGLARQIWFATGHTPIAVKVIEDDADNDGVPELAVLSTRNSDGLGVVEVKNANGAANARTLWGPSGYAPTDLEIVPDADANGVPDVAVLSSRDSDGRILVQVRNANGLGAPYSTWFAQGHTAIDLVVTPDKDADGIPEVAVLSSRDSDGRAVVELKNASGTAQNRHLLWMPAGYTGIAVEAFRPAQGASVPQVGVLLQRNSDGRALVSVRNAYGTDTPRSILYPVGYTAHDFTILPDVDDNGIDEAAVLLARDSDGRILVQSRNTAGLPEPRSYWFAP